MVNLPPKSCCYTTNPPNFPTNCLISGAHVSSRLWPLNPTNATILFSHFTMILKKAYLLMLMGKARKKPPGKPDRLQAQVLPHHCQVAPYSTTRSHKPKQVQGKPLHPVLNFRNPRPHLRLHKTLVDPSNHKAHQRGRYPFSRPYNVQLRNKSQAKRNLQRHLRYQCFNQSAQIRPNQQL